MRWQLITFGGDRLVYKNGTFNIDLEGNVVFRESSSGSYHASTVTFNIQIPDGRAATVEVNCYEDAESWDDMIKYLKAQAAKDAPKNTVKAKINLQSFKQSFANFNPLVAGYWDMIDTAKSLLKAGYITDITWLENLKTQFQQNAKIIPQ